jgi:hypothetical protein
VTISKTSDLEPLPNEGANDAAVADFIRRNGVTRCPTACVLPTQASVAADDRAALAEYAEARDRIRRVRTARQNMFFAFTAARPPAERG